MVEFRYETMTDGVERVRTWPNGGDVLIHRLCAVAWFGEDAVTGNDVHHRVPIPWLNVESNLTPLPPEEHAHLTGKFSRDGTPQSIIDDVTEPLGEVV